MASLSSKDPANSAPSSTSPPAPDLPWPVPPAVILVRPREEGNIGMAARAMANMGLRQLILVEPAPSIGGTARGFGVGGWPILDSLRRVDGLEEALAPFQLAVGTSSARHRPLKHQVRLDARELARELAGSPDPERRVALVFGPEDTGLSRAELERCNPVVVVPCAPDQPTLNLAQAVLIVAYEIHRAQLLREDPDRPDRVPASDGSPAAELGELEGLLSSCAPLVRGLGFDQDQIHRSVMRDLRLLMHRAGLSHREAGVLRRLIGRASRVLGFGG